MNELLITGNAGQEDLQRRGWFIGHFIEEAAGLRHSREVEVKWGQHPAGESKAFAASNQTATTLSILVSGRFQVDFPELLQVVLMEKPGDYAIWAAGVGHSWQALADSVVISVRWPSLAGDQTALKPAERLEEQEKFQGG